MRMKEKGNLVKGAREMFEFFPVQTTTRHIDAPPKRNSQMQPFPREAV
jgi:hypothetical protein